MKSIFPVVICCLSLLGCEAKANNQYDDYCDQVLGDSVEGAVVGGIAGAGLGAISDGKEGAKRGAAIGTVAGTIDGLVDGVEKRERCRRDMQDLEEVYWDNEIDDSLIERELIDSVIEDEIEKEIEDDIANEIADEFSEDAWG
ncbi:hypothetical protein VIN01S_02150 [Vibrio inusitatus NBRC 102082]|uniref:Glycine zipper domain-containing protein n=1 Tax=Vibrio inusitatus NBRC 102082 TaxID=1219070 RepID=A0A4Y3HR74_9VIBR|nr:hypothetical protein [Vibrio inusitatus]GEA49411.1 hypothetical protein VIN01S_02150 [Vibrio inusitatus NBRC 102082]